MMILASLKRLLHLDGASVAMHEETHERAKATRMNIKELELSQDRLRRAVEDTGFFLGDALVRQTHDRDRTMDNRR